MSQSAIHIIAFAAGGTHTQVPLCAINPSTGQTKNCCNAAGFADCPRTGFGVDLLLNFAKNRTDLPNEADVRPMTIAKVAKFKRPKKSKWNQSCDKLVEYGEGTPLRVSLYLQATSKYERGAEACNCNLTGESNND